MLAIRIRLNKRTLTLTDGDVQDIGVRLKDGEYRYLPWAGFADIELARRAGMPVKCAIVAYCIDHGMRNRWIECTHLQGCLVAMNDSRGFRVFTVVRNGVPVDVSARSSRFE